MASQPTKLYLAGPMRGYREFNFPAFREQRRRLLEAGYHVFCPAERDEQEGFDPTGMEGTTEELVEARFNLREALAADLGWILSSAQGVAVLPGWENSSGAYAEVALARCLGLPVARVTEWLDCDFAYIGETPLDHAAATLIEAEARVVNDEELPGMWSHSDFTGDDSYLNGEVRVTTDDDDSQSVDWKAMYLAAAKDNEVRVTDPDTGGQKGTKPERYDLIPVRPLAEVARHYGKGAEKYDDNNWRRGYRWSLSYAALQRHANRFWSGERLDPETHTHHLAAVVFHAFTLMQFEADALGTDDRGEVAR